MISFSTSPITIIGAIATISLLVCGALRVLYLAVFHPLAKIPGPTLYSFSVIPYLYHNVRGEWPRTLKKLHDRYGPVVRYTPSDVSFTTPDAWKRIYGHKHGGEKSFEKDRRFYRVSLSGMENIITANNEDHKRMRRLLSHAFSEKALRGQENIIKHYVDLFITKLNDKAHKNEAIDIVRWYNFTTFDLIGDLAFGEPFGCLESGGYHPWVAMIFDGIKASVFSYALKRMPSLKPLSTLIIPKSFAQRSQEHFELSANTTRKRITSGGTDREDFMSYILRHQDEKGMNEWEIIENASVLIIAGSETTATQLSGTTFQLLTNHDAYDKVVKEIRTTFSSEDEITLLRVNDLEYMLAVLNEAFRMYPPVPIGLPRIVPKDGEFIDGYWIPEDTIVSVSQWAAYQSDKNFTEPQKFIPERWLGDVRFAHDVKDVLNPFSVGPRNCIGKNLAFAEMRFILARLLWNFDLELMPESYNWHHQNIYKLWEKGELRVKLTPVVKNK